MAKGTNHGGAALADHAAGDFYRPAAQSGDARPARTARTASDVEADGDEPFLRSRRRVPVRRGVLPAWAKTRWGRPVFAGIVFMGLGAVVAGVLATRNFLEHDARFRIQSAAAIQIAGNSQLTRADLLSVFGLDIGRNIFLVPLTKRRIELEQIPWVENATVMRLLPSQIRIAVTERTPIAFVREKGHIELADAAGVILEMTPQEMAARHYSFPVVSGINPGDPLSVRAARMHLYQKFIGDLDSSGEAVSSQLSEIDLTDPEDVRATVPARGSDLLLHFGQEDFLARWRNYQAHIAEWRQQYPQLASVDLRYDREVVLKMAGSAEAPAAGQKTAASARPEHTVAHRAAAAKRNARIRAARAHHVRRRAE